MKTRNKRNKNKHKIDMRKIQREGQSKEKCRKEQEEGERRNIKFLQKKLTVVNKRWKTIKRTDHYRLQLGSFFSKQNEAYAIGMAKVKIELESSAFSHLFFTEVMEEILRQKRLNSQNTILHSNTYIYTCVFYTSPRLKRGSLDIKLGIFR